tara:strand:- start:123 stop:500 length:378 start_codon:yes stop_codon:yes gene_type:complete
MKMKKLLTEWRKYEQQVLLVEEFEQALQEGTITDWIRKHFDELKSLISKFTKVVKSKTPSSKPFIVALDKWKKGEELTEKESEEWKAAARNTLMATAFVPGGAAIPVTMAFQIIKHLVTNNKLEA